MHKKYFCINFFFNPRKDVFVQKWFCSKVAPRENLRSAKHFIQNSFNANVTPREPKK